MPSHTKQILISSFLDNIIESAILFNKKNKTMAVKYQN